MTDSDRSARLTAVSNNFQVAVRRAQELEKTGTYIKAPTLAPASFFHSLTPSASHPSTQAS